jgi:hypothetical protein
MPITYGYTSACFCQSILLSLLACSLGITSGFTARSRRACETHVLHPLPRRRPSVTIARDEPIEFGPRPSRGTLLTLVNPGRCLRAAQQPMQASPSSLLSRARRGFTFPRVAAVSGAAERYPTGRSRSPLCLLPDSLDPVFSGHRPLRAAHDRPRRASSIAPPSVYSENAWLAIRINTDFSIPFSRSAAVRPNLKLRISTDAPY